MILYIMYLITIYFNNMNYCPEKSHSPWKKVKPQMNFVSSNHQLSRDILVLGRGKFKLQYLQLCIEIQWIYCNLDISQFHCNTLLEIKFKLFQVLHPTTHRCASRGPPGTKMGMDLRDTTYPNHGRLNNKNTKNFIKARKTCKSL